MKKLFVIGLFILLWLLASCTPEATQENTEPAGEDTATETAEEALSPVEDTPTPEPTGTEAATLTPEPTAEEDEEMPEEGESEPVEPVEVDVSKITPEPTVITPPQEAPAPGVSDIQTWLIEQTRQDLAKRLGVDVSEVVLVSAMGLEWRDSSLGCPEPGMGYLTVITPGFKIVFSVDGEEYAYHADSKGRYVLCQDGMPLPPVR